MSNSWLSNQVNFSAIHVRVIAIATPFFRFDCTTILAHLSPFLGAMDESLRPMEKLSETTSLEA